MSSWKLPVLTPPARQFPRSLLSEMDFKRGTILDACLTEFNYLSALGIFHGPFGSFLPIVHLSPALETLPAEQCQAHLLGAALHKTLSYGTPRGGPQALPANGAAQAVSWGGRKARGGRPLPEPSTRHRPSGRIADMGIPVGREEPPHFPCFPTPATTVPKPNSSAASQVPLAKRRTTWW